VLLAHLSDLHLRDARDVAELERQLDRIAGRSADHLAITGDLLDRWNPALLGRALDAMRDRSLLDPERLTILHGNHDLASSGGHPRDRRDLWRLIRRFWDPPPLLSRRRRLFYQTLEARAPGLGVRPPFVKPVSCGARIAAIDTVPAPWRPLRLSPRGVVLSHGIGQVRRSDVAWLSAQRGEAPLVVMIHHYPLAIDPWNWGPRVQVRMDIPEHQRDAFWDAAEGAAARLVLCGHVHRARLERHRGIAVGLNGQSGADWAGRTIAYYRLTADGVSATAE
jgi:3',5'-cyclic AMP phosphodiesterase CpdA